MAQTVTAPTTGRYQPWSRLLAWLFQPAPARETREMATVLVKKARARPVPRAPAADAAAAFTAGEVFKAWRLACKLSQLDVERLSIAGREPVTHTTVSRIEHDVPGTRAESYRAYLRVLCEWERRA